MELNGTKVHQITPTHTNSHQNMKRINTLFYNKLQQNPTIERKNRQATRSNLRRPVKVEINTLYYRKLQLITEFREKSEPVGNSSLACPTK